MNETLIHRFRRIGKIFAGVTGTATLLYYLVEVVDEEEEEEEAEEEAAGQDEKEIEGKVSWSQKLYSSKASAKTAVEGKQGSSTTHELVGNFGKNEDKARRKDERFKGKKGGEINKSVEEGFDDTLFIPLGSAHARPPECLTHKDPEFQFFFQLVNDPERKERLYSKQLPRLYQGEDMKLTAPQVNWPHLFTITRPVRNSIEKLWECQSSLTATGLTWISLPVQRLSMSGAGMKLCSTIVEAGSDGS